MIEWKDWSREIKEDKKKEEEKTNGETIKTVLRTKSKDQFIKTFL
jgi:hypothetical protein